MEMKKIKEKLRLYYPENEFLTLEHFILFEMAVSVITQFKKEIDPQKGYIFFTKYYTIGSWEYDADTYLLQKASVCLKLFRSEKVWKDILVEYQQDIFKGIRLYEITECGIEERDTSNLWYSNRKEDYLNYIKTYQIEKKRKYATTGEYKYSNFNNKETRVTVTLEEDFNDFNEDIDEKEHSSIRREEIVIPVSELKKAAKEMKEILPGDYCQEALQRNKIIDAKNKCKDLAKEIVINQNTNIVGMVGSGKTTLLKILAYILDKQGKKCVIVVNTVPDVFSMYRYFRSLGCSCSPLIGKNERVKYINQIIDADAFYLDEDCSKYLTTNCLIDGLDVSGENAVSFGQEPCTKLMHNGIKHVCPYYDHCPTTAMQREVNVSNIVITTDAGLSMSRVGKMQDLYLNTVLNDVDVVFFDEADRIQKSSDETFIPETSINQFIQENSEKSGKFMGTTNEARLKDPNKSYYSNLVLAAPSILESVSVDLKSCKNSKYKAEFERGISAYTLVNLIKQDISEKTVNELYKLMDSHHAEESELYDIMIGFFQIMRKNSRSESLLEQWLDKHDPKIQLWDIVKEMKKLEDVSPKEQKRIQKSMEKENEENASLRKIIQLVIKLIYFDQFIVELGDAYAKSQDVTKEQSELISFLQSRFTDQQDLLPSSLMGNLFGVKLAKDDDVILYRQYAYGREVLTNLPFLKIDEEGNPLGPHVVLLSGSSYAEGSFQCHVNLDVNYIIEADAMVRNFISKTNFIELGLEERVSGSSMEAKEDILKRVVNKCMGSILLELEKEGKILVVVNSYAQADVVARQIRSNLSKQRIYEGVCSLTPDKNEMQDEERYIRRGEVQQLYQRDAKILVAPAMAIERGYNIVDENGHSVLRSVFFLVRPMNDPNDIKETMKKINGYVASVMSKSDMKDVYKKSLYVRKTAQIFQYHLTKSSKKRLDNLEDGAIKKDIIATMFVLILQIFGRLCRVTDPSKNPPSVYFADGAFRKKSVEEDGFDTLNELYLYLKNLIDDPNNGPIAKTLYEPFFVAFEKGIRHE